MSNATGGTWWLDGSTSTYRNWNGGTQTICACCGQIIWGGLMQSSNCGQTSGYICKSSTGWMSSALILNTALYEQVIKQSCFAKAVVLPPDSSAHIVVNLFSYIVSVVSNSVTQLPAIVLYPTITAQASLGISTSCTSVCMASLDTFCTCCSRTALCSSGRFNNYV